jgi:hypothetical protein
MTSHYKCIRIDPGYTGKMFHVDAIYKSVDTENTPAVIDSLGHVRVITDDLRFLVGHRPSNLTSWRELPIFAYFAPAEADNH